MVSRVARAAAQASGVPPKVLAWLPGWKTSESSGVTVSGADGESAAEGLGHGNAVGPDAVVLEAEPFAGAADAGLHFVEEEQDFLFVAERAQAGHEFGGGGHDAAFALDGLAQDGDGGGGEGGADGVEVVELGVGEAGHEGLEALLVLGLARGGHGGEGAAMERVLHGDDFVAGRRGAPLAGQLEEALVGLGAGVAEEDLAAEGEPGDLLREPGLELVVEEVGAVHEDADLLLHGGDDGGMAVAGVADGDARHEVEIFLAGVVPDGDARAAHEGEPGRIGGHDELAVEFLGARVRH